MKICYPENREGNNCTNKIPLFNKKFCLMVSGLKKPQGFKKKKRINDKGGKLSFRPELQFSLGNLLFWFLTFPKLPKLLHLYRKDEHPLSKITAF